jgi:hypothetical protein
MFGTSIDGIGRYIEATAAAKRVGARAASRERVEFGSMNHAGSFASKVLMFPVCILASGSS